MSGFAFDANIIIDALGGYPPARAEILRAVSSGAQGFISRMAWIEVLSKGDEEVVRGARAFMSRFGIDEINDEISLRAASLRVVGADGRLIAVFGETRRTPVAVGVTSSS